jgi:hypothetical protein
MRNAVKRTLYAVANSSAMNGLSANVTVSSKMPWWQVALLAIEILFAVLTVLSIVMWILSKKKNAAAEPAMAKAESKPVKKGKKNAEKT